MQQLLGDVRRSLRVLVKERTFSATVLVTLALCLGAKVAIYSVVHAVLLEPLPFPEPDRLVVVSNAYPGAGVPRASNGSVDFFQRRENIPAFQEVAIYEGSGNTVGESGSTERVTSLRVSPSFFPLLGIQAALGRTFLEEEMDVGSHQKVVLPHAAWQEYFGGSADAVGRDLRVDGRRRVPQSVATMYDRVATSQATPRFQAMLIGTFALVAMLLAAVGLHGSLSHAVRRRQRELGVRMALGADASSVLGMVLAQGMRVAAAGLMVGMLATLALSRVLAAFLYDMEPYDPLTLLGVAATLILVSAVSCLAPARRATSIDPVRVLSAE